VKAGGAQPLAYVFISTCGFPRRTTVATFCRGMMDRRSELVAYREAVPASRTRVVIDRFDISVTG
jgi:hypothetical protein